MLKISKTTKNLIIVTLVTSIIVGVYVILFSFLKDKNEKVSDILNQIDSSLTDDVYLRNLNNSIEDYEREYGDLDSYFVVSDHIVEFLETIEGLSKYTNAEIEVKSIKESEYKNSENINQLDLNVIATGNWKSVYHSFVLLENLPFKVDIKQVQFNKTKIKDGDIEIESWRGSFDFSVLQIKI